MRSPHHDRRALHHPATLLMEREPVLPGCRQREAGVITGYLRDPLVLTRIGALAPIPVE